MSDLYSRIESKCRERGITITKMCADSGVNRASLTDLKMGRKKTLSANTLQKIATFFGCAVDDLLREEGKEKAPTVSGERPEVLGDDKASSAARTTIMVELFEQLSVEDQNDVLFHLLEKARGLPGPDEHR